MAKLRELLVVGAGENEDGHCEVVEAIP